MDPLLSIRRSTVRNCWVVERKAYINPSEIATLKRRQERIWRWCTTPANDDQRKDLHKNRIAWQAITDEVVSAEQGKRVIVCPRILNQFVYDSLCKSDLQRYGGFARFCTEMEEAEEKLEADQERVMSNKRKAMSGEVFDILNFLERKRSEQLNHGQLDLNYLLHGKPTKEDTPQVYTLDSF